MLVLLAPIRFPNSGSAAAQPAFVRGGSILADGLLLTTDGSTKLYLVQPDPAGFKPLASAVVICPIRTGRPASRFDLASIRVNWPSLLATHTS